MNEIPETDPTVTAENGITQNNITETSANTGIAMRLDYAQPSQVISESVAIAPTKGKSKTAKTLSETQAESYIDHVALFAQLNRPEVAFHAEVKQPLLFRDCLLALFDIVSSDYRYVPKDRAVYSAFKQMRKAHANTNLFASQQAYFDWLYNNDPLAYCILDPMVQVHEAGVTFEVFSKDEGSYASLTFDNTLFGETLTTTHGTTYIDYSPALLQGIEQIRSYRDTRLDIGYEAVQLHTAKAELAEHSATTNDSHVIEKRINVPKSWIRSLLQVQSATQLTQDSFSLDPVALYNLLFELRMHADIKGKKRGLLIELVPQQAPVLTLEPFNISIKSENKSQSAVYQGQSAKLLRLWGRRRLALLKRVLPYTDDIKVTLLGQGMPSYWTLTGKGFHLTFAMTGFTQANWSQSLNFDLLLPKRPADSDSTAEESDLITALQTQPQTLAELYQTLGKTPGKKSAELRPLLIQLAQQGLLRFDVATQQYLYRPLTDTPLDMAELAFHNLAEKQAYDLVSRPKAISNLVIDRIATPTGQSVAVRADITVSEDRRTYHSQLQLNDEGMVSRAECSCPQFLQHRLTQGVCSHLITLRLAYAEYASQDENMDKNRRFQQSKLFSKRVENQAVSEKLTTLENEPIENSPENAPTSLNTTSMLQQIQLTLNQKKLVIERTGIKTKADKTIRQQFLFNQPEQAYQAFLNHIAQIQAMGFLENQAV